MLGQVLILRHIPALEFIVDISQDYGERIDGILHKLGLEKRAGASKSAEGESDRDEDEEA